MTEITWNELGDWVNTYAADPRMLFIPKGYLDYRDVYGHLISPFQSDVLNEDTGEVLKAKRAYLISSVFDLKNLEERKQIVKDLGVSLKLKEEVLMARPELVEVFA
jgi:hypothetical protein